MAVRRNHPALTVLKFVLAAVIAIALVKIAFFPAGSAATAGTAAEPGADFTDPVVTPVRGDITASVTLDASVVQDAPRQTQAELAGEIDRVNVADGAEVAAGAVIARIRQEVPVDPREVTGPDGEVTFVPQAPRVTTRDVTAPVGGTVDVQVLKDQQVSVGDPIATVQPASTSVVAALTPEQRYRLVNAPADATVELRNGPGTFTCTGVTVTADAAAPAATDPAAGDLGPTDPVGSAPTARVRCAVPAEVTVFPGLAGTMRLDTGSAQDVLTLPTTAVQGTFESGTVWVSDGDGVDAATATPVTLGLTDGKVIEITGGIEESTQVLEFAPVANPSDVETDDPNAMGDAGMVG